LGRRTRRHIVASSLQHLRRASILLKGRMGRFFFLKKKGCNPPLSPAAINGPLLMGGKLGDVLL
jgi:hypothetical protein